MRRKVIQFLVEDLAGDELGNLADGQSYEIWSPESAFDAADALLKMISQAAASHREIAFAMPAAPK